MWAILGIKNPQIPDSPRGLGFFQEKLPHHIWRSRPTGLGPISQLDSTELGAALGKRMYPTRGIVLYKRVSRPSPSALWDEKHNFF